jgi:hypothetical protein
MRARYYIQLPNPAKARGDDPKLSFRAVSAEGFAEELQNALRDSRLFQNWKNAQVEPDDVDESLGVVDQDAHVHGEQNNLRINLVATTSLPGTVFKHRMRLLAGAHWELHDVTAG